MKGMKRQVYSGAKNSVFMHIHASSLIRFLKSLSSHPLTMPMSSVEKFHVVLEEGHEEITQSSAGLQGQVLGPLPPHQPAA